MFRGGRRESDLFWACALAALYTMIPSAAHAQAPVGFGFDARSLQQARVLGMPVTYGSAWAGAWNQKWGWNGLEEELRAAKAAGATPVVQWWYWGDDISPSCVEHGCVDRYQGVSKDKATWTRLSNELADLVVRVNGAHSQAIVVIETEFNKNGIEIYEPFDGYLAAQAAIFHQRGLRVVVGFGNWGQSHWTNFDRAVAAADLLGTMALQSSLRDSSTYHSGADQLISAAQFLQRTFAKPTFVTDFGFSSYPEPAYATHQDAVIKEIFRRMGELKAAGVQGMVWRMLADDPAFDTNNYHGIAERYWGLLHADGSRKPGFTSFLDGMRNATLADQPPAVRTIHVSPATLSLTSRDQTIQLKVTGLYDNGTQVDLTSGSQGTTYAATGGMLTVNADGLVRPVRNGNATIVIANNSRTSTVSVTVAVPILPLPALAAPFGAFDTPAAGATVAGSVSVSGWALDDTEVSRVEIWRDRVAGETTPGYTGPGPGHGKIYIADAVFVSGARPDIESAPALAGYPLTHRAGWGYLLLTQGLYNQGNGTFTLHAIAYDRDGQSASLGSKTVTAANQIATQPFGSIDTPAYGQTVTTSFWNFGWALTPKAANGCSVGPAGVQVSIDSGPLMPVSYGAARADIAAAFPGFTNEGGAGGAFYVDTSRLSDGPHQIGWFVTDSCGRADGVGSRFFTVRNQGSGIGDQGSGTAALSSEAKPSAKPIEVRRGVDATTVYPGAAGDRVVAIGHSERVQMHLSRVDGERYTGYQVVKGERRALPLGSSLDAEQGIFYWQPMAGFLGVNSLEFESSNGGVVRVRAVIGTSVQAAIDTPQAGEVAGSFTIAGWAIDLAAAGGSGIDAVHVWAHPVSDGEPVFLGEAAYGDGRPDIGALYGEQFTGASFSLAVEGLAPGAYDLVVYPHSAVAGDFGGAQVVRVNVQ